MSRTRATALALVNWKGVFYERYQLDRHVTALEGANGAGKTTVMIAAYVVLLPDLSRLRFTNLGESGATGGDRGIHGRLGEPGRPSYAVLELALASGERLLAGVRLVRGAEPAVEATPFVITGLPATTRLQDLLLVRQGDADHVPELAEVKDAVRARGGAIEIFKSVKDYLADLFERGVTPLRLATEEDRTKLNEMLRTSMTGGISRALTTELRAFLLKEESGLGDTLSRMRANLEACRRTRTEVGEARHLEREITGVYEAGQAMFAAAIQAARELAEEGRRRVDEAGAARADAERTLVELAERREAAAARQATLEGRLGAAQLEVERALAARDRRAAARTAATRLAELADELAVRTELVDRTRIGQAGAAAERTARKLARARAGEAYDQAAHGLAHLQAGLDELHRRAHAHRTFGRRLAEAQTLLERPVALDDVATVIGELTAAQERHDAERARLERAVRDADARARDHGRAAEALAQIEAIVPGDAAVLAMASPHERARAALARLAEREALATRSGELDRELAEAERLVTRQRAVRERAAALGLPVDVPGAAGQVQARLEAAEAAVRKVEDEGRSAETAAAAARTRLAELATLRRALDERAARWALATERAARLAAALEVRVASRADVLAVRDRLGEATRTLTARRTELTEEREALQRRAGALASAGELDPALLRVRDELGAELLASRFEDADVDEAGWIEARLGPLAEALLVEDVDAAAATLASGERERGTVWLVRADAVLDLTPPASPETRDAVTATPVGVRVTRRPAAPVLGRRARERRAAELREEADALGAELETLAERGHRLTGWRRDADHLLELADVLAGGDPAEERERADDEHGALTALEPAQRTWAADARRRVAVLTEEIAALRRLLGEALLLEPPDHAPRLAALAAAHALAHGSRAELDALAGWRRTLGELVDELRAPPPSATELAAAVTRRAALADQLDRGTRARAALEDVLAHRAAAGWADAEAALAASVSLAPALEAQHVAAREAVAAADVAITAAEADWEAATAAWQDAEGRRAAAAAHHERVAAELGELGGALTGPDEDELARGIGDALRARAELDVEARHLVEEAALTRDRAERAAAEAAAAHERETAAAAAMAPALAAWDVLAAAARGAGLLDGALAMAASRGAGKGSAAFVAEAASKRDLLFDRLAAARGGAPLATELRTAGGDALSTWLAVRDWLRQRVPAQVADVADPLEALERLRDHLDVLEGRLARQERDLRGASEDVARGIDVQLRRARGQVRRLNQHLDGVHFGSVAGVRVEMRRVERMEQILRALRDGEAQELLFLASMPIEEALDEIFRRHGGGRGGGLRLLDYREYLDLVVEVRRQGTETWEPTSPTRLSTGEAIGVGAALMMVVLTEWERDSQLLHGRRTGGSLRFLFLDEANRLSRDNLGILFELCRNLDLQLLVAAPEVARAEGNTTYRLLRQLTDDGREEVIVSGRRAVEPPVEPAPDPVEPAPAA